jgi:hypothetical protein
MINDNELKRSIRVSRSLLLIGLSFIIYHLSISPAGAQMVRFGFKGGLELTQMEFSSDALRDANRAGFYIGPQVKFKLPVVGLGIDVSALYSRRSLKVEGEELRQESLLLPAHVRYGAAIGELVGVFLCAGPQLSFNLGDDILYWQDRYENNKQYILQNTMLSLDVGVGATIGSNLEAVVFYNLPLGKTADFTWDRLGTEVKDQFWNRSKTRTNAWHVSLSYYF